MDHRLSLDNFEPFRCKNISKERIFDTPKRNLNPPWRKQNLPFQNINHQPNPRVNQYLNNEDEIFQFNTLPELNLEKNNHFVDDSLESTGYLYKNEKKQEELKNIKQKVLSRNNPSKSPINRIKNMSKSPKQGKSILFQIVIPTKTVYKVFTCSLEPFHSKSFDQYKQLDVKINFNDQWECFVPNKLIPDQIGRISKQDELYILKGDYTQSSDSYKQMLEKIKQHLIAQNLLKLYQQLLQESQLNLPETQFQYSNILMLEKINANEFRIAERYKNTKLEKYNGPNGEIYSGPSINSNFLNAFSFFTFKQSNDKFMILNIQGYGSQLTDPHFIFSTKRHVRRDFFQNYDAKKIGKEYFKYIEDHFAKLQQKYL